MISDVLSDAVESIREYQRQMPAVYNDLTLEISRVVTVMDELRRKLDGQTVECVNGEKIEQGESH